MKERVKRDLPAHSVTCLHLRIRLRFFLSGSDLERDRSSRVTATCAIHSTFGSRRNSEIRSLECATNFAAMRLFTVFSFFFLTQMMFGQKLMVKVVDRHESTSDYSYVIPGYSSSRTTGGADCTGMINNVCCNGSSATNTMDRPTQMVPFQVRGDVGAAIAR